MLGLIPHISGQDSVKKVRTPMTEQRKKGGYMLKIKIHERWVESNRLEGATVFFYTSKTFHHLIFDEHSFGLALTAKEETSRKARVSLLE